MKSQKSIAPSRFVCLYSIIAFGPCQTFKLKLYFFFGELSRNTKEGEDVVDTYKGMNSLSQEELSNEMFDAVRRFKRDLDRIEEVARPYANQHRIIFNDIGNDWLHPGWMTFENYHLQDYLKKVPEAGTSS